MAQVDVTIRNTIIVGLMAFAFIVLAKTIIRSVPTPQIVRQAADMV